jgi:8-oxo-dGTP diphosphatase
MPPQDSLPAEADATALEVAAGVIRNADGQVLIAQRPAHLHQGGLWEFPGGKLEPGETPEAALRRELKEELDIDVDAATPLINIHHNYPDRRVRLSVWQVERFQGVAKGVQGQPIRWVKPDELPNYPFPAANRPIVAAARLPDHYAILEDERGNLETLKARLNSLVTRGVRMIQLRAKRVTQRGYVELAEYAVPLCRRHGVRLLLNTEPSRVRALGAQGVHLGSARLMGLDRRPLDAGYWVGASCHSLGELRKAERIGIDFAVLSPVRPTASHPGLMPLGWAAFAALVEQISIPVYALGGLSPADLVEAQRRGAQGVAGIRGFLDEDAP